jgi:outer membrane protein OmpA-like peptidoglycan-associated protein
MKTMTKTFIAAALLGSLAACGGLPDRVDELEQARLAVRNVEQDRLATQVAGQELSAAREALDQADAAYQDKESIELIRHKAYVAQRYADISKQRVAEAHAKEQLAEGESERNRVVLESRERVATQQASAAQQQASAAQQQASAAQEQAAELQARTRELQEQNEDAQRQAREAAERNQQLQSQLSDLQAKQTERGLVLTLGDVLFDTAQASLKPGAGSTMDRLAKFMTDYPQRKVTIEGHTDSRGSDDYNVQLSQRRADAVRAALVMRGVDAGRIQAVGLGEAYPVASNDSPAGMQQNRRVEIVISDEAGQFPSATQRSARS